MVSSHTCQVQIRDGSLFETHERNSDPYDFLESLHLVYSLLQAFTACHAGNGLSFGVDFLDRNIDSIRCISYSDMTQSWHGVCSTGDWVPGMEPAWTPIAGAQGFGCPECSKGSASGGGGVVASMGGGIIIRHSWLGWVG